jgi:hypothetical protein
MNNYDLVIKSNTLQLDAQNSAMNENARYMESMKGKLNTLKATVEGVWGKFLSSDFLKSLIIGFTSLVSGIDKVMTSLGGLNYIVGILITTFLILKGVVLKDFIISIASTIIQFGLMNTVMGVGTLVVRGLTTVFIGLWNAIKLNPIGFIAGIVMTAVKAFGLFSSSVHNSAEAIRQSTEAFKQQKTEIENYAKSYKELAEKAKTDTSVKIELIKLENELKDKFKESAQNINLQTDSIDENVKAIKNLLNAKAEQFLFENKGIAEDARN